MTLLPFARRASPPKTSPQPAGLHYLVPPVTLLVLMLVSVVPLSFIHQMRSAPFIVIMAIYFWSIHKPEALPLLLLFTLGMVNDLLAGDPLVGMSALIFVGVGWGIGRRTSFFRAQNFLTLWFGFSLIAVVIIIVQTLLSLVFLSSSPPLAACLMSLALNVMLYPFVAGALHIVARLAGRQRFFAQQGDA